MSHHFSKLTPPEGFVIDPDCDGRPECPSPQLKKIVASIIVAGVILAAADMLFYSTIGKNYMSSIAKDVPDALYMSIGYIVVAVMFCVIYTNYARISRIPYDPKKESENSYRLKKGIKYGLAIGTLIFIPTAAFNYAVLEGLNLGNQTIDAIFHVLIFGIVGITTAFLQMPTKNNGHSEDS